MVIVVILNDSCSMWMGIVILTEKFLSNCLQSKRDGYWVMDFMDVLLGIQITINMD